MKSQWPPVVHCCFFDVRQRKIKEVQILGIARVKRIEGGGGGGRKGMTNHSRGGERGRQSRLAGKGGWRGVAEASGGESNEAEVCLDDA